MKKKYEGVNGAGETLWEALCVENERYRGIHGRIADWVGRRVEAYITSDWDEDYREYNPSGGRHCQTYGQRVKSREEWAQEKAWMDLEAIESWLNLESDEEVATEFGIEPRVTALYNANLDTWIPVDECVVCPGCDEPHFIDSLEEVLRCPACGCVNRESEWKEDEKRNGAHCPETLCHGFSEWRELVACCLECASCGSEYTMREWIQCTLGNQHLASEHRRNLETELATLELAEEAA